MITFTIYGDIVAQQRPKFARIGKYIQTYDPKPCKEYKKVVQLFANQAVAQQKGFVPYEGPVEVVVWFFFAIPKSYSMAKRMDAANGRIRPTGRPDLDNLVKGVMDAVNGILWKDDSIVVALHTKKYYTAGKERVWMGVKGIDEKGGDADAMPTL
jgi:Holliday junction resolvase RusA-like endonuclease